MAEFDRASGQLLRENVYHPGFVAPTAVVSYTSGLTTPTVTFNHFDRIGSVVATSSAAIQNHAWTGNGAFQTTYTYDPFGESATLTGAGFGYAGYRYDAETGLYHTRNRYYDPRLGRFLSAERALLRG